MEATDVVVVHGGNRAVASSQSNDDTIAGTREQLDSQITTVVRGKRVRRVSRRAEENKVAQEVLDGLLKAEEREEEDKANRRPHRNIVVPSMPLPGISRPKQVKPVFPSAEKLDHQVTKFLMVRIY